MIDSLAALVAKRAANKIGVPVIGAVMGLLMFASIVSWSTGSHPSPIESAVLAADWLGWAGAGSWLTDVSDWLSREIRPELAEVLSGLAVASFFFHDQAQWGQKEVPLFYGAAHAVLLISWSAEPSSLRLPLACVAVVCVVTTLARIARSALEARGLRVGYLLSERLVRDTLLLWFVSVVPLVPVIVVLERLVDEDRRVA